MGGLHKIGGLGTLYKLCRWYTDWDEKYPGRGKLQSAVQGPSFLEVVFSKVTL